ncbi:Uncharacterized protein Adt_22151 [Abeliophyllum distichum]|uniref:C3H1-type domain-containing protein n=1 Tax=Abeliophyllum distichum TaxID=126358 RepID=A0ABD1T1D9_9LAMI
MVQISLQVLLQDLVTLLQRRRMKLVIGLLRVNTCYNVLCIVLHQNGKNLAGCNFVPTPSRNSMQLREVVLMRYPSPSSAIRWGIYASPPNRPLTFGEYSNTGDGLNPRAGSCASSVMQSGLPFPVRGKLSISPKYMDRGTAAGDFHLRDYHSPISPLASAAQPCSTVTIPFTCKSWYNCSTNFAGHKECSCLHDQTSRTIG